MGDYTDLEKNRAYNFLLNLPDLIKNLSDTNLQMVVHFAIMELTERGYEVKWGSLRTNDFIIFCAGRKAGRGSSF